MKAYRIEDKKIEYYNIAWMELHFLDSILFQLVLQPGNNQI